MRLTNFISFLILIFILSCETDSPKTRDEPLSIDRAKKTYEKMFSGLRGAKSRYGDYKLFWDRGWYYELAQGKVLYIPLQYIQPGFLTYEKGEKINTSLMSHLMVLADERGNLTFNIIRSVPDQEQVSSGKHYIKSAPFSGTIFIDDMDGNLAEGFVYKDGELKGKIITSPEKAKVNATYEVCYTWEYYSCTSHQNRIQAGHDFSWCTLVSTESQCYYVSDENGGNPGYGGGGGVGNNASLAADVINNFSDSCFTAVLNKIAANSLNNALSTILNNFYVGQNAELYFDNGNIYPSSIDADAVILNLPSNRFQITLNEPAMVGASQEYIAATILHEVVHAYFDMSGISPGNNLAQHQMMTKYVEPMSELIHYLFKDLTYQEADALAWGGLGETSVWSSLSPAEQDSIININQYYKNVNGTRANAPGTKCN